MSIVKHVHNASERNVCCGPPLRVGFDGIKSLHIDMRVQMNLKTLSVSENFWPYSFFSFWKVGQHHDNIRHGYLKWVGGWLPKAGRAAYVWEFEFLHSFRAFVFLNKINRLHKVEARLSGPEVHQHCKQILTRPEAIQPCFPSVEFKM